MALAQDYKKISDGDKGKNTGGMGSYSPVPFVEAKLYKKILEQIIYPTYDGLLNEGIAYKGVLYGGIMVSGNEPLLLEYNCRFGDPETQAILPRLDSDLLEVIVKCADGKLGSSNLKWDNLKSVCVVLASRGYPETSSKDDFIGGLDVLENNKNVEIFHAGTKSSGTGIYTNGGRVLSIVANGKTFKEARRKTYKAISDIKFDGMQYRNDIALKVEEEN
jgi:phosphoribosylamine--glycine ligase